MNLGYQMGNYKTSILCYADDAILLSPTVDGLQRMLYQLQQTTSTFNLRISVEKTKSMMFGSDLRRCKLALYDRPIEQVTEFRYLGVELTSYNNIKETMQQIQKGLKTAAALNSIIFCNNYISTAVKTRIYKTSIRPIITYGAECRTDTTRTKSAINATEMRILRRIQKKTRRDRFRNEEIRKQCDNIQDINKYIRDKRRNWNKHVDRRLTSSLIKSTRDGDSNTKRPPGKPPKR